MKKFLLILSLLFHSSTGVFLLAENNDVVPVEVSFSLYPNPAVDIINVFVNNQSEKLSIKIFNALGSEIYSSKIDSFTKIDVSEFKNSIYIVNIYDDNEIIHNQRLVVNH